MASSQNDKNEKSKGAAATDDTAEIKHKLAMRMAFAGVMIVALLGGLALFDYYSAQPEPEVAAPPQFTEPVPVAKKMVTQPVTPPVAAPEAVAPAETTPAEPEATSAPVDTRAPRVDMPPPPVVAAQPSVPRKPSAPVRAASPVSTPAPAVPVQAAEASAPPTTAMPAPSDTAASPATPRSTPAPTPTTRRWWQTMPPQPAAVCGTAALLPRASISRGAAIPARTPTSACRSSMWTARQWSGASCAPTVR